MKFLAIIEVTDKKTTIALDKTTILNNAGIPLTQEVLKDVALMVENHAKATAQIKELWEEHQRE